MSVDKKIKKKLHLERIKKQQIIVQHAEQHKAAREKAREEQEALTAAMTTTASVTGANGEVVWSAKTQEIKNRITGKKRAAMSRWGRFAGTSDSGGMGR